MSAPKHQRATFYGTSFHKVSERNQVALPKHQKRILDEVQEGQILLTRFDNDPFLRLYTQKQFDRILDVVKQNPATKALADAIAEDAEVIEPDSQGRFVLPGRFVAALEIKDEVAICGVGNYMKIWPAELKRESKRAETPAEVKQMISGMLDV